MQYCRLPPFCLVFFTLLGCGSAGSSAGGVDDTAGGSGSGTDGSGANSGSEADASSSGSGSVGAGGSSGNAASGSGSHGAGGGFSDASLTSAGSTSGEEACVTQSVTAYLTPPLLQFVIDRSGSMNREVTEGQTRWSAIVEAIQAAIETIPETSSIGVSYFPTDMGCQVSDLGALPIAGWDATQQALFEESLVENAPFEFGGTPTQDAFTFAVERLESSPLEGPRYVVLITDGGPTYAAATVDPATANHSEGTCNGDGLETIPEDQQQALVDEVRSAFEDKQIGTFVIGAPGTDWARPLLSELARAGGSSVTEPCGENEASFCHYDLIDIPPDELVDKLSDSIASITGDTLGCSYEIPPPPSGKVFEHNTIGVELTLADGAPMELERDPSETECNSGWQFSSTGTHIELCGQACDAAQRGGSIDIVFKCDSEVR